MFVFLYKCVYEALSNSTPAVDTVTLLKFAEGNRLAQICWKFPHIWSSCSLLIFIAILVMKRCSVWSSHQEFPSVTLDGASVYGELPYSPRMTAAIFWRNQTLPVASMLKNQMNEGTRFEGVEGIEENDMRQFFAIPKKDYYEGFHLGNLYRIKCMVSDSQQCEGD